MEITKIHTLIVGASAAGLACAACLARAGVPYILLEKHPHVGQAWRNHYDRLHLNTDKKHSALPYLPFPKNAEAYLSRDEVVAYLEGYVKAFSITPVFNQEVIGVEPNAGLWEAKTSQHYFLARNIIIATGFNSKPYVPNWPGMDEFKGSIIHSSSYKNGKEYKGKQVLVIGFGNSACEISICLHEYGAFPSLSVKGAVNIVPRGNGLSKVDSFFDSFAWVTKLAPKLIDSIAAPYLKARFGDMGKYGLRKLPYGPNVQIMTHRRVPLLDIGAYELIRNGIIKVYPGIEKFTEKGVRFLDGSEELFDVVILGTGYRTVLSDFLPESLHVIDSEGRPFKSGGQPALPGLYFCGFFTSPLGMLREIGLEAKSIARAISQ